MGRIAEKWREFREWQQRPHEVALMSEEWHSCHTCGREFQGNYCPRCGQSARIGRYSFKNALLLFLDVWGLGNRGMFRTLRDLILRPGYMIRDYLSGMQMAYFPPFKLFFLLTALSIVVESGVNVGGVNYFEKSLEELQQEFKESFNEENATEKDQKVYEALGNYGIMIMDYAQRFPNISTLAFLVVLSGFLYLFFRKSPNIPDLRYSELLVALVYTADMYSIYNILLEFFCIDEDLMLVALMLPMIPLKQMSGFKWWKIILMIFSICIITMMVFILLGIISVLW